jgi:octaheme c-type cytochrome (tetrathionate reductase family)
MTHARIWIAGLLVTVAVIAIPVVYFLPDPAPPADDPWAGVPQHPIHTSHADLLAGPFEGGQEVTAACLSCHPEAAHEVMQTTHWTWESAPVTVTGRSEPVTIGKINQINNFCISAQGNQKSCMSCHTGYGWQEGEQPFDFANAANVDCLVCHAQSDYAKGPYGNPAEGVDLLAAARSVAAPGREQCGTCHFNGGGGNGVKHGDLDASVSFPSDALDVHMGQLDFVCTDCHQTSEHVVKGRLVADNYVIAPEEQVACSDCHSPTPHGEERLNAHTASVACQTCHIPAMATGNPTKLWWDWSTAGLDDLGDDHFTYLKIKGSFVYGENVTPTYRWYNGSLAYRYLLGDTIDPSRPVILDDPAGDISDPSARIFPFKLHFGRQPFDTQSNILLAPITAGPDGYWTTFDWDSAFRLAEERMGLPYSGEYGFAETWMYWPTAHLVQPKENALACTACHGAEGRLDWQALGYPGDPMEWGGRFSTR